MHVGPLHLPSSSGFCQGDTVYCVPDAVHDTFEFRQVNYQACTWHSCWEYLLSLFGIINTHTHTTALWPFFRDHPGEPVPEENFWPLWCKGRLTEADILTIWLGATPSGLTSVHLHHPHIFYGPDAFPAAQPTVSKHWRQNHKYVNKINMSKKTVLLKILNGFLSYPSSLVGTLANNSS